MKDYLKNLFKKLFCAHDYILHKKLIIKRKFYKLDYMGNYSEVIDQVTKGYKDIYICKKCCKLKILKY